MKYIMRKNNTFFTYISKKSISYFKPTKIKNNTNSYSKAIMVISHSQMLNQKHLQQRRFLV